jgi:hypothetical protein
MTAPPQTLPLPTVHRGNPTPGATAKRLRRLHVEYLEEMVASANPRGCDNGTTRLVLHASPGEQASDGPHRDSSTHPESGPRSS